MNISCLGVSNSALAHPPGIHDMNENMQGLSASDAKDPDITHDVDKG